MLLGLGLVYLLHAGQTLWILRTDRTQPFLATHTGYWISLRLHQQLEDGLSWAALIETSHPWPPLPFLLAHLQYRLFGVSIQVAAGANLLWLALLLWSVYRLGQHFGDPAAGLLAALVLGAMPMVLGYRPLFTQYLAMAALVTAAAEGVAAGRESGRTADWLRAGLALGAGLLVRWDFLFYAAPPALWAWRSAPPTERPRVRAGLARAAAVAGLVAGWWYAAGLLRTLRYYAGEGVFATVHQRAGVTLLSLENLLYHPRGLLGVQAGWPLALLAALALWRLVRLRHPAAPLLLAWILLPWLCYLLLPIKGLRYTLALLPACALAPALAARTLAPRGRRAASVGLALLALGQTLALVHLPGAERWWPALSRTPDRLGAPYRNWQDALEHGRLRPWRDPSWDRAVASLSRIIGDRKGLRLLIDGPVLNYVAPVVHTRPPGFFGELELGYPPNLLFGMPPEQLAPLLARSDRLILADPPSGPLLPDTRRRPLLGSLALPDGRRALVYGSRR